MKQRQYLAMAAAGVPSIYLLITRQLFEHVTNGIAGFKKLRL
jgi:hypothetical protein